MDHGCSTIGIIGAGQMGNGIAQVAATAGFDVVLQDISQAALDKGLAKIQKGTAKLVAKGRLDDGDRSALLDRISTTLVLGEMADGADAVIEAATEDSSLKFQIFEELDRICKPGVLLLSNTSSVSITQIGGHTKRAADVMGIHFMNPVPLMRLVELIKGLVTSDETFGRTEALARAMGKETVRSEDYPGFIVNRVLLPMINEACYALMEHVGGVEDIDTAMRLGANHPMGPFQLADLIGLDTCLAIMEVLHNDMGDAKYRPCPLLQKYVHAGYLGRKAGRGFYEY